MKSAQAEGLKLLRAAIYARKSNAETKSAEDKSVEVQIRHAREFIQGKGWRVAADHVYADDAISGAEFQKRPALNRLLAALPERGAPPFDVLVIYEKSRLGRAMRHTDKVLGDIIDAGVRVFYSQKGVEVRLADERDEITNQLDTFADASYRTKIVDKCRDTTLGLWRQGRNFGGRCYGYDNVWLMPDGTEHPGGSEHFKPKIAKTIYRKNETEAQVVRSMFQMYADGYGAKVIAYCLNGEPKQRGLLKRYFGGTRPPKPVVGKRGTGSWSPSAIHDMLRNPRYFGRIPYGATQKKYIRATKRTIRTGEEQFFDAPDLRIIDDKLAAQVAQRTERMAKVYLRSTNGQLGGRPETGRASRYLLSGLVRCESCGSAMVVSSSHFGSGKTRRKVRLYVCSGRHNRGPSTCSNAARPRLEALDAEVLKALNHHISPAVVRAAARRAVEIIRAQNTAAPDNTKRLREELKQAEAEAARYVAAIGAGGKLESLVAALAGAEARRDAMRSEIAEMESSPVLDALTDKGLEQRLRQRAAQWREVLTGDLTLARQGLRALLSAPITFAPDREGFRLRGSTRVGALWAPETIMKMASPRGFEPRLPP